MIIKKGDNGPAVSRIQAFLGITSDGTFGPVTEAKVKEWQAANGLPADGIVGPATSSKMFGETQTSADVLNLDAIRGQIPAGVLAQIPDTAGRFNITTPLRLAHFLSQCGHESGGFVAVSENLNYSADGLKKTFPSYFPGKLNESYARQPERIANRVYSSRMGNGNETSGDGWKFRGRGYIQLTGKHNYTAFDRFVDDDILASPDLVATKYPLASAAFFFNTNGVWPVCDRGSDSETVKAVTRKINGGLKGLADRQARFTRLWNLLRNG